MAAFLYSPSKGSKTTYYSEKNPRSRIRGVESGIQVIRRGAVRGTLGEAPSHTAI